MIQNSRRSFFRRLSFSLASLSFSLSGIASIFSISKKRSFVEKFFEVSFHDDFSALNDRVWIGEKYWAIPMEDWHVKAGRLEFRGTHRYSRVNLLTTVIKAGNGSFTASTDVGLITKSIQNTGEAGFSIGIKDNLDDDVKAACYYGKSLKAGVSTAGSLFIGNKATPLPNNFDYSDFNLTVTGKYSNNSTQLTLSCKSKNSTTEISYTVNEDISGLVALTNNFQQESSEHFWFKNFSLSGSKVEAKPNNSFGPILWTMHTLSNNALRIMAQMPPISSKDNQNVQLFLKQNNAWKIVSTQPIDDTAYTVHFIIDSWDSTKEIPYRIVYKNHGKEYKYEGQIRKEPNDRPLKFGGLTCQEWGGYPYTPLVKNLKKHNQDAASTALFGLKGANGVIVITTKRGKEGKITVSFNSSVGVQTFGQRPKLLQSYESAMLLNEGQENLLAIGTPNITKIFTPQNLETFRKGDGDP